LKVQLLDEEIKALRR